MLENLKSHLKVMLRRRGLAVPSYQMLAVVKQGGYITLFHTENEAEHQKYEQLHQWNFTLDRAIL